MHAHLTDRRRHTERLGGMDVSVRCSGQLAYHLRDLWLRLDAATLAATEDPGSAR